MAPPVAVFSLITALVGAKNPRSFRKECAGLIIFILIIAIVIASILIVLSLIRSSLIIIVIIVIVVVGRVLIALVGWGIIILSS